MKVASALVICLVSPPALSQSCTPHGTLEDLFVFSQIAERPGDRVGWFGKHETTSCSDGTEAQVPALIDVPVPAPNNGGTLNQGLREVVNQRAFAEPPPGEEEHEEEHNVVNVLYVGCRQEMNVLGRDFDLAVEMRFFLREPGVDVIQMDVVRKPSNDKSAGWDPFIDRDGRIITLPGTDKWQMRQILSNFGGEGCVFPAAKFTVYAMCMRANEATSGDGSSSSLRTDRNGRPTLVGHSLGGAAAQFIASSRRPPTDGYWPDCPGVNAYTFGSIGLNPTGPNDHPSQGGTLTAYTSGRDRLVRSLFGDRVQTGHLFTLSSTTSHSIDDIQKDLCNCLRGNKNHEFRDHGSPQPPPDNLSLYSQRVVTPAYPCSGRCTAFVEPQG